MYRIAPRTTAFAFSLPAGQITCLCHAQDESAKSLQAEPKTVEEGCSILDSHHF